MLEGGFDLLILIRQGNPTLEPKQAVAAIARVRRRALGMCDATPRGHEIHRAWRDLEHVSFTVAMHDASVEQIGNRRKANMGMGPDVQAMSRKKLRWPHLIEKDEWTNHLPLVTGQSAAHLEAVAQMSDSRNDDDFQRITGLFIAEYGISGGQPTHFELRFPATSSGLATHGNNGSS